MKVFLKELGIAVILTALLLLILDSTKEQNKFLRTESIQVTLDEKNLIYYLNGTRVVLDLNKLNFAHELTLEVYEHASLIKGCSLYRNFDSIKGDLR